MCPGLLRLEQIPSLVVDPNAEAGSLGLLLANGGRVPRSYLRRWRGANTCGLVRDDLTASLGDKHHQKGVDFNYRRQSSPEAYAG